VLIMTPVNAVKQLLEWRDLSGRAAGEIVIGSGPSNTGFDCMHRLTTMAVFYGFAKYICCFLQVAVNGSNGVSCFIVGRWLVSPSTSMCLSVFAGPQAAVAAWWAYSDIGHSLVACWLNGAC
jgi:hypothetical protein